MHEFSQNFMIWMYFCGAAAAFGAGGIRKEFHIALRICLIIFVVQVMLFVAGYEVHYLFERAGNSLTSRDRLITLFLVMNAVLGSAIVIARMGWKARERYDNYSALTDVEENEPGTPQPPRNRVDLLV